MSEVRRPTTEELFRSHNKRMIGLARAKGASEPEDVVQNVWRRFISRPPRHAQNISGYLDSMAVTGTIDGWRHRTNSGKNTVIFSTPSTEANAPLSNAPHSDMERKDQEEIESIGSLRDKEARLKVISTFVDRLDNKSLQTVLRAMDPDQLEIFMLAHVGGHTYEEIREIVGLNSKGTVQSKIGRGKEKGLKALE